MGVSQSFSERQPSTSEFLAIIIKHGVTLSLYLYFSFLRNKAFLPQNAIF